ncbi:hypothetical protein QFZ78_004296 [Paenibacillus sp. V4I5]|nr:hypothetical protein [Paenibacillus sp. V4I5]
MFFYSSDLRNLGFSIVEGSLYYVDKISNGDLQLLGLAIVERDGSIMNIIPKKMRKSWHLF